MREETYIAQLRADSRALRERVEALGEELDTMSGQVLKLQARLEEHLGAAKTRAKLKQEWDAKEAARLARRDKWFVTLVSVFLPLILAAMGTITFKVWTVGSALDKSVAAERKAREAAQVAATTAGDVKVFQAKWDTTLVGIEEGLSRTAQALDRTAHKLDDMDGRLRRVEVRVSRRRD